MFLFSCSFRKVAFHHIIIDAIIKHIRISSVLNAAKIVTDGCLVHEIRNSVNRHTNLNQEQPCTSHVWCSTKLHNPWTLRDVHISINELTNNIRDVLPISILNARKHSHTTLSFYINRVVFIKLDGAITQPELICKRKVFQSTAINIYKLTLVQRVIGLSHSCNTNSILTSNISMTQS